jgi:hypothetical protein
VHSWVRKTLLLIFGGDDGGGGVDSFGFGGATDGQPGEAPRVHARICYGAEGTGGRSVVTRADEEQEIVVLLAAADL